MDIDVRVQPRASRNEVAGERAGRLLVRVTAPPVDGKANAAVCAVIAKTLGVPKGWVNVVRGETSRNKVVRVEGVAAGDLKRALGLGGSDLDATVITTRDGVPLAVRPIEPNDKAALLRHFEHLSEESRYRRFLAPIRHLTARDLAYFTELDHRRHDALIAVTTENEVVAVARCIRLPSRPDVAEVAVAVVDDWQNRGVGKALLQRLAERARGTGVRSFLGICLIENRGMQQLLRELGPVRRSTAQADGSIEIEVELLEKVDQA